VTTQRGIGRLTMGYDVVSLRFQFKNPWRWPQNIEFLYDFEGGCSVLTFLQALKQPLPLAI